MSMATQELLDMTGAANTMPDLREGDGPVGVVTGVVTAEPRLIRAHSCQPRTFSPGSGFLNPRKCSLFKFRGFSPGGCFSIGWDEKARSQRAF
jgi:hypothetical protein